MVTGGSVPASSPTSPVASGGGASPRNADHVPDLAAFDGAEAGRLGVGVKIGGRRGGCGKPGGHDGLGEEVAGAAEAAVFAGGFTFGVGRSGGLGAGPETSPVG